MAYAAVKSVLRTLGLYRTARWVHRHVIARDELRLFAEDVAFYSQFIRPGDLCFDVGANYGAKSEVFLQIGARVIAFEPQGDCLDELVARLGSGSRLVPVNAAVGSSVGRQTLFIQSYRVGSSLLKEWEGDVVGSIEVPVTTLDEAIGKFGLPRFCKIDVEGFELEVLKGLSHRIPVLSFEYHLRKDGVDRALECLDRLAAVGEFEVNISAAEEPRLAREQWWSRQGFAEFFRNEVARTPEYHYGDIYVRAAN